MKLDILKYALTFIAGAGSGIAGAYVFLTKKHNKKLTEEIYALDKYYQEKLVSYGIVEDKAPKVAEKDPDGDMSKYRSSAETEKASGRRGSSESSLVRGERIRQRRAANRKEIDYTSFYKGSGKSEEEMIRETEHPRDDEAEDTEWEENHYAGLAMTEDMAHPKDPKIIKSIDFGSEPGFKTQTLLYYQDNDVLTIEEGEDFDEDDIEDFSEQESIVGDALVKYGFKDDDTPVIYVRNYDRMVDYEIEKVFGAYEEE